MRQWISLLCALAVFCSVLNMTAVPIRATEVEPAVTETTVPESLPPETEPVAEPSITTEPTEPTPTDAVTEPPETTPEALSRSYDIPLYYQTDYSHIRYGTGTIASSGCSVTCLAMVATCLTGHTYLPDELAACFATYTGESLMGKLEYMSSQLQLPWEKAENFHVALNALREGKIVIALMGPNSLFTDGQHFIVLTGINENGKILVNDPNADNYNLWNLKQAFVDGFEEGDISYGYSGAWIYDPVKMPAEPFVYTYVPEKPQSRYGALTLTDADEELLAKMIWVEAQGEEFAGQQAIAEVVLNRLISPNFQDTIPSIILAENQFRSVPYLEDAKPTSVQYEAIRRAIEGPYVLDADVVHFATYPVTDHVWGTIGGHIFCYPWLDAA